MSSLLEKPAKKLFLVDLCKCQELVEDRSSVQQQQGSKMSSQAKAWLMNCSGIKITCSMVTVQGVVVQTRNDGDMLVIDDGTAVAIVKGCSKIPFNTAKPNIGFYVMVVGQLQQSGTVPVIRAIKLQNLSHNVAMATIWPLEVIDELGQNGNIT